MVSFGDCPGASVQESASKTEQAESVEVIREGRFRSELVCVPGTLKIALWLGHEKFSWKKLGDFAQITLVTVFSILNSSETPFETLLAPPLPNLLISLSCNRDKMHIESPKLKRLNLVWSKTVLCQ